MADSTLVLTQPERDYLTSVLTTRLGDVRVEFHHTQAPDYREQVQQEEQLVKGLLAKLGG
jgi:hypothetical protein